jgi:LysM repeat protein
MMWDRRGFFRFGLLAGMSWLLEGVRVQAGAGGGVYTVKAGDTLAGIARAQGLTLGELKGANQLKSDRILVGQKLLVPEKAESGFMLHVVARGDTLGSIGRRYSVGVATLRKVNNLKGDRILVGQRLRVPVRGAPATHRYIAEVVAASKKIRLDRGRWRYVVGHHSAIQRGNARIYDRNHREQRRMAHGLAYHFVIGNGIDSGDGEVEIGQRWLQQLHGGHVRRNEVNETGIGICLVGNFERVQPSRRQLEAFTELVRYLRNEVASGPTQFAVHREIDRGHTLCPGRHFPTQSMHRLFG